MLLKLVGKIDTSNKNVLLISNISNLCLLIVCFRLAYRWNPWHIINFYYGVESHVGSNFGDSMELIFFFRPQGQGIQFVKFKNLINHMHDKFNWNSSKIIFVKWMWISRWMWDVETNIMRTPNRVVHFKPFSIQATVGKCIMNSKGILL